jgi:hypothetical protein
MYYDIMFSELLLYTTYFLCAICVFILIKYGVFIIFGTLLVWGMAHDADSTKQRP